MKRLERLAAADLRSAILRFHEALLAHERAINRLNVYPVPDADTGTNMALTVGSTVAVLEDGADMGTTCRAVAEGSLMGARGISGVILSQVMLSLADRFSRAADVDGRSMADALVAAQEAAYAAVLRPVEGTMLTVVREAAEAARAAADVGRSLVEVLDAADVAAGDALVRTPDLLPALGEAGVVDAGGAGVGLLLDALLSVALGRPMPEAPPELQELPEPAPDSDREVLVPRFEVTLILDAPDDAIALLRERWAAVGQSVVAVGGEGVWSCHVHTDDPDAALAVAREHGLPRNERITDLHAQVAEEVRARRSPPEEEPPPSREPVPTAVVSVGAGEGLRRIFRSLGAQRVVGGGRSMNPSVAQLLEAVESAPADQVVILPNDEKVVAVAEQVQRLTGKAVQVVPTTAVAEGLSALRSYEPDATLEENADRMGRAASRVRWGEITQAVRDSAWDRGTIRAGDWLGITREGIRAARSAAADAAADLLDHLVRGSERVTILEGDGSNPDLTRRILEWLAGHRPEAKVEVHEGGQPLYPYLFGVEEAGTG